MSVAINRADVRRQLSHVLRIHSSERRSTRAFGSTMCVPLIYHESMVRNVYVTLSLELKVSGSDRGYHVRRKRLLCELRYRASAVTIRI